MDMERRVEALLNDFIRMGPPGCGLVIARGGRTICRMCAGYADVEAGVPLRGDTIVRLYSNSKVFTSVAAMEALVPCRCMMSPAMRWVKNSTGMRRIFHMKVLLPTRAILPLILSE